MERIYDDVFDLLSVKTSELPVLLNMSRPTFYRQYKKNFVTAYDTMDFLNRLGASKYFFLQEGETHPEVSAADKRAAEASDIEINKRINALIRLLDAAHAKLTLMTEEYRKGSLSMGYINYIEQHPDGYLPDEIKSVGICRADAYPRLYNNSPGFQRLQRAKIAAMEAELAVLQDAGH